MFINRFKTKSRILALLVVGAVVTAAVLVTIGAFSPTERVPTVHELPSFTMRYALSDGQSVTVGNRAVASRQERRLVYTSYDNWVETVLVSAPAVTRVGTFSAVGSYRSVNGDLYTEYNALDGSTTTSSVSEGLDPKSDPVRMPPAAWLTVFPIELVRAGTVTMTQNGAAQTSARVCFEAQCTDNYTGLSFTDGTVTSVYADDARGIPLKIGDSVEVLELTVHSARMALP